VLFVREKSVLIGIGKFDIWAAWIRRGSRNGFAFGLVLLLAGMAGAQSARVYRDGQSWVEESSGTLPSSRSLRVNTPLGSVKVEGDGHGLRWTVRKRFFAGSEEEAKREFARFRVDASRNAEGAILEVNDESHTRGRFDAEFELHIPARMEWVRIGSGNGDITVTGVTSRLDLNTRAGDVAVDKVNGAVRALTKGGNLKFGHINGDLLARTGGGNITLGSLQGHRLEAQTLGGNIDLGVIGSGVVQNDGGNVTLQRCTGSLNIGNGGGDITVDEADGPVTVSTHGGNIRVGSSKGPVIARTGGGNIALSKLAHGADARSGMGRIQAEFLASSGAVQSTLHTGSGDIVVYVKSGVPLTVRATTDIAAGQGIRSDFPEMKVSVENGGWGPKMMFAEGLLNGGGPLLNLRTSIGQIDIRRGH
jgi:DUF4097 and DUF4098 domain-containing protein YvlB